MDPKPILARIKRRLDALDLSQDKASELAGKSDAIRNIHRAVKDGRDYNPKPDTIEALARALQTTPVWLLYEQGSEAAQAQPDAATSSTYRLDSSGANTETFANTAPNNGQQRQLMPVFGAAEGGEGALILTKDPVEYRELPSYLSNVAEVYGVFVREESMWPRYEAGEVAEVAPHIPFQRGDDVLLYRDTGDADERVMIKRLVKWTADEWTLEQFNPPKTFTVSRKVWTRCHVVVGRGSRRL